MGGSLNFIFLKATLRGRASLLKKPISQVRSLRLKKWSKTKLTLQMSESWDWDSSTGILGHPG